jgi:hypothetical protein
MLTILALPLLLAPVTPTAADLAAEGEAYLKAAETADHPLDVLVDAHASFDSAYLVGHDAQHLCRALDVAELALRSETFADDEERRSWEETRQEDLDRLQQDAATRGRGNCRFRGQAGRAARGDDRPGWRPPADAGVPRRRWKARP